MTVGQRIRAIRLEKGLTQKQVGELAKIAEPTIRRYELDKLNPKKETVQKIADALKVPISDLLYDGVIRINTKDAKPIEEMTPEEICEQVELIAESLKKFSDTAMDYILDVFPDGNKLLLSYYDMLNHEGRKEAIKRVQELSELTKYTEPDTETPQD